MDMEPVPVDWWNEMPIGMNDKNGKRIREGDTIKMHYFYWGDGCENEGEIIGTVRYSPKHAAFGLLSMDGNDIDILCYYDSISEDSMEIIHSPSGNEEATWR